MNGQSFTTTQFTLSNLLMIAGLIAVVSMLLRYIGRTFASEIGCEAREAIPVASGGIRFADRALVGCLNIRSATDRAEPE